MPALGHPPPCQLNIALLERRLQLEEEQSLFDVEDPNHEMTTLATGDTPRGL
jgi:hypothetical protein